jgi:hypothetical protein
MLHVRRFLRKVGTVAVFAVAACVLVDASVPRGWSLAGTKPTQYAVGVDEGQLYQGHPSAFLKSMTPSGDGFGTLMQTVRAERYTGKRVRLSGNVKSQEAASWAGLWMRIDQGKEVVAIDNIQDRATKGTTGWQMYEVVLDVPQGSTGISFGILLDGGGEVWLNSTKFEVIGREVPVTGPTNDKKIPNTPLNLEFTE